MKILVVSQYYYPERFLINDIVLELVKHGHEVTILTGLPNYPSGIIPSEYKHGKKRDEYFDGLHVLRCREFGRRRGKFNLVLNYASFAIFGSMRARKLNDDFDVIFCYQLSPITMVIPAIAFKKKFFTPIFLYCLDIWPESAQAHVNSDRSKLYEIIKKFSKNIYQLCDKIAVTSEPFISYLKNVNDIPADRITYIPQHADETMLYMDLSSGGNGIVDFMFAGNIGYGQKIETIVNATAILKDKSGFLVHVVGDGSLRASLENFAKDKGVADIIIFHGQKDRDEMYKWYKKADALLITLRGNNFVGNTMPGKLQTYMTAGKPIFGAINGAAKQVIEDAQCGACVPAEDAEGLALIMADYIDHPEKYKNCGENAKNYFRRFFSLPVFMGELEKELMEIGSK